MPLTDDIDNWVYPWGSNIFALARVYKLLIGHTETHPSFIWLWTSKCQPKHKVFFWLLMNDRLSTRNILTRRTMQLDSYNCVLCNQLVEETVEHLFVDCPFARMCWDILNIDIPVDSSFPELSAQLKIQLNSQFFVEAIILLCWAIWTARNDLIFKGVSLNLHGCRRVFFSELLLLQHLVNTGQKELLISWIQSLE